jgi:hypothetical protein
VVADVEPVVERVLVGVTLAVTDTEAATERVALGDTLPVTLGVWLAVTDAEAARESVALRDTLAEVVGDVLRESVRLGVKLDVTEAEAERERVLLSDALAEEVADTEMLLLAVRDADTVGVMPAALWPMRRTRWQPGSAAYSAPVTGSIAKPPLAAHIRKEADVPMPSAQPAAPLPAYVLTSREPVSTRRMTALPASATNRLPAALSASA